MNPAGNECVSAVMSELEAHGLSGQFEHRGKHGAVVWRHPNGKKLQYFVALTPSDHRAPLNCRSDVRKMLRPNDVEVPVAAGRMAPAWQPPVRPFDPGPLQAEIAGLQGDVEALTSLIAEIAARIQPCEAKVVSNYQETSRDAWEDFAGVSGDLDLAILRALRAAEPIGLICYEIEQQINRSHQSVSGNLRHLVERDVVVFAGTYGKTPSGRRAMRWRLYHKPAFLD